MLIAVDSSQGKRVSFVNSKHDQSQHRQVQVPAIQEVSSLIPSRQGTHLRHYRRQSRLGAKDISSIQVKHQQHEPATNSCKEQQDLTQHNPNPGMLLSSDPSFDDNGGVLADLAIVPTFLCKCMNSLFSRTTACRNSACCFISPQC